MRTPTALSLAATLVLILAGCGSSGSETSSFSAETSSAGAADTEAYSGQAVTVAQSCAQLQEAGGMEAIKAVDALAADLEAGAVVMGQNSALKLRQRFDPAVWNAEPAFREHLEAISAVPQLVIENVSEEEQAEAKSDMAAYTAGRDAVVKECFPDSAASVAGSTTAPTEGTPTALISRDTERSGFCGTDPGSDDQFSESDEGDYTDTFGQAWEAQAKGQECLQTGYGDPEFLWEMQSNGSGGTEPVLDENEEEVLVPQARKIIESVYKFELNAEPTSFLDDKPTPRSLSDRVLAQCFFLEDDKRFAEIEANPDDLGLAGGLRDYTAALQVCPDHPQAKKWQALVKHLKAAEKAEKESVDAGKAAAKQEKDNIANHNVARDGGHYLIGKTLTPGLYRTDLGMVTNCYWEISDAQGNIIDNNFISTAPQFDLYIPATAAGFTISGCSMTRIGD